MACYTTFSHFFLSDEPTEITHSFIFGRLSSMESMVITMHIMTQQMKGMPLSLDVVGVILEIAACAGRIESISVETVLNDTMNIFSEVNFESRI